MKFAFRPKDTRALPVIRAPKIWYRKKLHPEGLFSLHREQFGKIVLPFPIPNPLFEEVWVDLIADTQNWDWEDIQTLSETAPSTWQVGQYLKAQSAHYRELPLWVEEVPVLPWMYRTSTGDSPEPEMRHFLNFHYARILDRVRKIHKMAEMRPDSDWKFESLMVYKALKGLFLEGTNIYGLSVPSLMDLLVGKEGLPRHLLSAYHLDYSGRAVIVPTLEVSPEEVALPLAVAEKVFYPWIWHESRMQKSSITPQLIRSVAQGRWVLINRQPTLYKYSLLAFRVKVWEDPERAVIGIHPAIVQPFNADFDGDTMAVWPVFSEEAQKELEAQLALRHHIRNRFGIYQILPRQDYLYALYHLTFSEPQGAPRSLKEESQLWELALQDPAQSVRFAGGTNSAGRRLVERIFEDQVKITAPLDKKRLQSTLEALNWEGERYLKLVDRLHQLHPWSQMKFDLQDLLAYMEGDRSSQNSLVRIVVSGARASFEQLDMMSKERGIVPVWEDQLYRIQSSFAQGLSLEEFYALSHQSRRSLVDKGITVSDPGYLSRRLFLATVALRITAEPCAGHYVTVPATLESKLRGLPFQRTAEGLKVRWVTHCQHPPTQICRDCFGQYWDGTLPADGTLIGAEISGYLSEPTTQMTLRVFHTGGLIGENRAPLLLPEAARLESLSDRWATLVGSSGKRYQAYLPEGYRVLADIGQELAPGSDFFSKLGSLEITQSFPELEKALELSPGWGIISPEAGQIQLEFDQRGFFVTLELDSGSSITLELPPEQLVLYPSGARFEAFQILVPGPLHHGLIQRWAAQDMKSLSLAWALSVADIYDRAGIRIPLNYLGVVARSLFRDTGILSLKKAMSAPLDQDFITQLMSERVKAKLLDYIEGSREGLMTQLAKGLPIR